MAPCKPAPAAITGPEPNQISEELTCFLGASIFKEEDLAKLVTSRAVTDGQTGVSSPLRQSDRCIHGLHRRKASVPLRQPTPGGALACMKEICNLKSKICNLLQVTSVGKRYLPQACFSLRAPDRVELLKAKLSCVHSPSELPQVPSRGTRAPHLGDGWHATSAGGMGVPIGCVLRHLPSVFTGTLPG
uniref:Uncharacterized protein n=1 Tax=Oryza sativa subsp. japonica TaxID=39947 RepID=Q2QSE6_ORYSJ|nr:hypothetical protein LOC_Os12g24380 [Oryza sativa Japonica Group]